MELEVPPLKRTGRPVHPLWTHFHRGEKRNRYHYHAFCSYCVARHGVEQVPPTRGVSAEMLRHLESCPNCPHKVLDTVKELCGQRERTTTPAKKNANGYSGSGNRLVNEEDENQVLLLDAMAVANATVDNDAAAVIASVAIPENVHVTRKRTGSETLDTFTNKDTEKGPTLKSELNVTQCTKRGLIVAMDEDIMTKWRTTLLQTAVATGISLSAFQESDFQKLLQVVSPMRIHSSDERISSVGSVTFLKETAAKFARTQLERVKENMLNSRIKSGLTLSVSCWCTLDLQHLVAFTLVNLKGDAACVRVEDVRSQHTFTDNNSDDVSPLLLSLTHAIEDVLLDLNEKHICVIGIVADSATALSAAKRVCRSTRWRSLLVVPCMFGVLTSLVGGVLTHDVYRDAVGQLVELAAYFTNSRLQALLRSISGDNDARIPLPTKYHWFSLVACLTKILQYSDAITVLCTNQDDRGSVLAPSALRELVLGNNCQIWKTLRGLDMLLAPLREAYNIMFQSKAEVGENNSACDNNDEYTATVQGGLTLAHVMYQFGRMSQQYAALAEPAELNSLSSSNDDEIEVVARRLHELLDTMWQRYDLPTMVLAYVFDFHMESERLDLSNSALQWKAVSSYFQLYFQRWFCQPQENQAQLRSGSTVVAPISSNKAEAILNAYQLRQFPFDAATTSDHTDMASFYLFVSDSHPEICALCCRIYGVVLACADLRRVIRGIGFVPSVAQTTDRPKQVELLLHVGYATSVKKTRHPSGDVNLLSELIPASHPEELLCSHQDWKAFSTDWKQFLDDELAVDELEQLQTHDSIGSHQDKNDEAIKLSLNQLFFEVLPPLPGGNFIS